MFLLEAQIPNGRLIRAWNFLGHSHVEVALHARLRVPSETTLPGQAMKSSWLGVPPLKPPPLWGRAQRHRQSHNCSCLGGGQRFSEPLDAADVLPFPVQTEGRALGTSAGIPWRSSPAARRLGSGHVGVTLEGLPVTTASLANTL